MRPALLTASLSFVLLSAPAMADSLSVSLGAGWAPQYRGADEYRIIPMPGFSWETESFTLKTSRLGLELDLVPGRGFSAGPIIRYSFGRDPSDLDDPVIARMSEIDPAVQLGGFAGVAIPLGDPSVNPLFLTARAEAMQALGGDQGMTADLSAGLLVVGDPWTAGVSATVGWADETHMDTFFGVNAANSAASGLPVFDPGAGFVEYGVEAFASLKLNEKWSVAGFGKWSRLSGDAESSPVVSLRGDSNQFFVGAAISYKLY